jgi:5-methylcytosine-specific restriction endonuclease McrA
VNTRIKRSAIWKLEHSEFESLVKKSKTYKEILSYFSLNNKGGNFKTLKRRILEEKIDDSHIEKGSNTKFALFKLTIPIEQILVKNSTYYNRSRLKKRLVGLGLLEYKCDGCKNTGEWNGKLLSLQLDHKNGVDNDNRLENLRFLCPNCHSQTSSFAGKNSHQHKNSNNYCSCGKRKNTKSISCRSCYFHSDRRYKKNIVDSPTKEQLEKDISEMSMVAIGKKYCVSDNAVRRWAKSYGIVV